MKPSAIALAFSAALACAACSQDKSGAASAPAPSATTNKIEVASSISAADGAPVDTDLAAKGPYLFDLLQRPDFSAAFAKLSGASDLPDWTRQGGTSAPAQSLVVSGKPMLVASGCKPHDCPSERIVVLYDEKTHELWGVFAKRTGEAPVDVGDTSNDQLSWLGGPGDDVKALLKRKLYSPE